MGLLLKGLAVIVGLMLLPLGGWPVSALLFLYAFGGLIVRILRLGRRSPPAAAAPPTSTRPGTEVAPPVSFRGRAGHPLRRGLGLFFLILAVVALSQRGTFSPFVFGGIGLVLLFWGTAAIRLGGRGSLRPVADSIVLRTSLDPFHWFAFAEVKLATKQAGRALGGMDETLLVTLGDAGPSLFVVLQATSLTLGGAEESLMARFGELVRISAPLGAYLLPVDSAEAESTLHVSVEPVRLDAKGWPSSLSTMDYDLLTVEAARGGFVRSVGAYKRGEGGEGRTAVPPATQTLSRPSLLWEVFQELGKKLEWQKPDGYTTFLASMFATHGETFGERVSEAGSTESNQQVIVQSLGTSPVKMSRAQLRAIARVYS
jgi:hypothetical protein